jgi:hypothetical protein
MRPHAHSPRVEFAYDLDTANPGVVNRRHCYIRGLTPDQAALLVSYASNIQKPILWLPVLGTWHRITGLVGGAQNEPAPIPPLPPYQLDEQPRFVEVVLDQYPDTQLGASTSYATHHFGVYAPPRPLLGEPTMQLPTNTCVDLNTNVSLPAGPPFSPPADYDILFAPGGSLALTTNIGGDSHVFLCVRDPRKGSPMDFRSLPQIQAGGEMMILGIKARSGAISVQPVDHNPITMTNPNGPYTFVLQSVNGQ